MKFEGKKDVPAGIEMIIERLSFPRFMVGGTEKGKGKHATSCVCSDRDGTPARN